MDSQFIEFKKEAVEQSIPDCFEKQVVKYPDRIAVKFREHTFTYRSLNRSANRIAHAVLANQIGPGEPVGFVLEHSAMQIAAVMGVLKSGNILVPLDPSYPSALLESMLADSRARLIVTNNQNLAVVQQIVRDDFQILNIDRITDDLPRQNPGLHIPPDSAVCIHYTSGSTGQPKGVTQNHRNVLHHLMLLTNKWRITIDDRIAQILSISFSASMNTIFGAILNGASIYPFDIRRNGFVQMAEWMTRERLTILHLVPSIFRQFVTSFAGAERFPYLRLVIFTGEQVHKKDIELYEKHFPEQCEAFNLHAGSEMFYVASCPINKRTEIHDGIVPSGYGVKDKQILLFNENGSEVGPDEIGEIVIKSRYLSPGYWHRPDLTRTVFKVDPAGGDKRLYFTGDIGRMRPDGCLENLGRKDFQVKIRGQRVETGEVETALLGVDNIKQTAVTAYEDEKGNKYLVAYIVPKSKPGPTVGFLRKCLGEILPDYKIPPFFVVLDALPYTPTGKVDRQALPKPDRKRPELTMAFVEPRNASELELVGICESILDIKPVGVKDNFVDLGMDSIQYLRLITEVEQRLGQNFPPGKFPQCSNIEELAHIFTSQDSLPSEFFKRKKPLMIPSPFTWQVKTPSRPMTFFYLIVWVIRFFFIKAGGLLIPYSTGAKYLSWFRGKRWAQAIFFRRQTRFMQKFLSFVKSPTNNDAVIQHSLECNSFRFWRLAAIGRSNSREFNRCVKVEGLSTFQKSYQKGSGVILASCHYAANLVVLSLLNRLGVDDILTLGNVPHVLKLLRLKRLEIVKVEFDFFFGPSAMYASRPVLERGGIVYMAVDGYQGTSGFSIPFHGRLRHFRAGFAELAVATGADVVPVFTTLGNEGHINVEFLDPLDTGSDRVNHKRRINSMIRQYAHLLDRRYAREPGNIEWVHIERFLELPPAS